MRLRSAALATKRVGRRLAAILAADVAGYSRLMNTDEEGTHAARAPEIGTPQETPESPPRPPDEVFVFEPFRLIPAQRLLVLDEGEPLQLGSRALDILIALVERAGETIHKDQL